MGLLRMMLALSVLTAHTHGRSIFGFRLLYGNLAVQCFFMISGFYMALVLNEKYNRPGCYFPFIWQRILRLFPAYLGVVLLTLATEGILSLAARAPQGAWVPWFEHAGNFPWSTWLTLVCSNLFIIGQQIHLFQAVDPVTGHFHLTGRFYLDPVPASAFIIIGQAWTLSLEFTFYLLAPLLVRVSVWLQILIVVLSVILRVTTYGMIDPNENPWHMDHFFPYELAFFMAGSVGYQIYRHQQKLLARLAGFTGVFRWIFLGGVLFYSRLPGSSYTREIIFVPILFLTIPLLFYYTRSDKTDRLIGELSYPLYLVHALVIFLMRPWLTHYVPQILEGPLYAALAVGSAYLIYRSIDEKVDDFRHRLFERNQARRESPA